MCMVNSLQTPLLSSRTTIRDLVEIRSADQLTMYINGFGLYEILNQVQDDTMAIFQPVNALLHIINKCGM